VSSIDELTNTRSDLLERRQQAADITLDNAVDVLNQLKQDVQTFNQKCQSTQYDITENNNALQRLLNSITAEIDQVKAAKAAADAAAAKTAADQAATLQKAKDSLQEYIASLKTQLQGINDNNLDVITNQIQSSAGEIRMLEDGYSVSLLSDNAILPHTKKVITAFKEDAVKEAKSAISSLNELKRDFDQEKIKVTNNLSARIQALEAVAGDVNVTADQITTALKGDKTTPTPDNFLGDIKTRLTALATKFANTATMNFGSRKNQIDQMIARDRATFQEKQKIIEEYQGIMSILDSPDFKAKEAAIQQNIKNAHDAMDATFDDKFSSMFDKSNKNLRFGIAITNLNTSISSLETELQASHLEEKLRYLQEKSAEIQPPPIDIALIQDRLERINAAKGEYDRLNGIQQARDAELREERNAAKARSQSPVSPRGSSSTPRTDAAPWGRSESPSDSENEEADDQSTSLLEQRRRNPQRPPRMFSGVPAPKRPRFLYIPPTNDKDDIYIIDLEKDPHSDSGGGGGGAAASRVASDSNHGGGKIIQRGGKPPTTLPDGAVMYRLGQTPEEEKILLLASLRSAEDVLNDEELIQKLKDTATKIKNNDTTAIAKYNEIHSQLISNTDNDMLTIARRAVYKSSILNLMGILDEKIKRDSIQPTPPNQQIPDSPGIAKSDEVPSAATRSKVKLPQTIFPQEAQQSEPLTYTEMYERLWKFMNSNDSVGIIKLLKPTNALESAFATTIDFSQIVGWTKGEVTNPNLDNYFNEFTRCGLSRSTFLTDITKRVNKQGQDVTDKNVAYRFKLNWIILIAFYCLQTDQQVTYENVGEFIKNTYDTFLDWMKKDKDTYEGMFFKNRHPVLRKETETYSKRVTKKLTENINSDPTFILLQRKITKKLCEGQMTTDAANHTNDPEPPSEDVSTVREIVPLLPSSKVGSDAAGATTTSSASRRQAWMIPDATSSRTDPVPDGPRTPPHHPFVRRPLASTKKVFKRIPVPPKATVPSLNLQSIPRGPVEIQSAKTSEQLLNDLEARFPQSARLPQSAKLPQSSILPQSARVSQHTSNVNPNNPAIKPGAKGSSLPGRFGMPADSRNNQVPEGTGDFGWLSSQPDNSQYVLLNPPLQPLQPAPPTSARARSGYPQTVRRQILSTAKQPRGGHKRTRKHRHSVPASAPATRRHHRDDSTANASFSHKRTRRRRASIRT
jgi:hypothetical protein